MDPAVEPKLQKGNVGMDETTRDNRTFGKSRSVRLSAAWYLAPGALYSVTCCCRDRVPYLQYCSLAQKVFETWKEAVPFYHYFLWGLCLMPDHLHALVQCMQSERSLGEVVGAAKSMSLTSSKGLAPLKWQEKFYDRVLREGEDPMVQLLYLVNNPVRKGLVKGWRDWPFTYVAPEVFG